MQGTIIKNGKIYIQVSVGDTKVSTDTVIYVLVPAGKTLKEMI